MSKILLKKKIFLKMPFIVFKKKKKVLANLCDLFVFLCLFKLNLL